MEPLKGVSKHNILTKDLELRKYEGKDEGIHQNLNKMWFMNCTLCKDNKWAHKIMKPREIRNDKQPTG